MIPGLFNFIRFVINQIDMALCYWTYSDRLLLEECRFTFPSEDIGVVSGILALVLYNFI